MNPILSCFTERSSQGEYVSLQCKCGGILLLHQPRDHPQVRINREMHPELRHKRRNFVTAVETELFLTKKMGEKKTEL